MNQPRSAPATPAAPPSADRHLRSAIQATLEGAESAGLEALQSRVLAQWQLRTASAHTLAQSGPAASLRHGPAHRRRNLVLGTVLLVSALAFTAWLQRPDPALAELLEPDVLSLIAVGEL